MKQYGTRVFLFCLVCVYFFNVFWNMNSNINSELLMKQYGTGGFCTETATFMKRATHTWSDTINWCICSHDYDPFVSLRISIFVKLCICGFSHTLLDTLNLCIFHMIPIYPPTHLIASDQDISVLPSSYRVKVHLDRRHLANATNNWALTKMRSMINYAKVGLPFGIVFLLSLNLICMI